MSIAPTKGIKLINPLQQTGSLHIINGNNSYYCETVESDDLMNISRAQMSQLIQALSVSNLIF